MQIDCRACGKRSLEEVLDLGPMPLAGDFRPAGEKNALYPLAVDVCGACGLLQVREQVPHSIIFTPSYSYSSSTVPALVCHFENYAREVALGPSEPRKRLLEIGCNDGIFLRPLLAGGYSVIGIDACENVVAMAQAKGLDVLLGVFSKGKAQELRVTYGTFDIITCSNVFAHNPNLLDFLEGIDLLLDPREGQFWVEVHSAHGLYEGLQWDCFYHEHCFYWSIQALARCLGRVGLYLKRYQVTPMHGGALRAVFSREGPPITHAEKDLTADDWRAFGARCQRSREIIREAISALPLTYAYGAAGRAVMLINWAGIASKLDFVVDGSPLRYGKVIPNTQIPIISEEEFRGRRDPCRWCFVTAHNYLQDIRMKFDSFFPTHKTKFVTPLPYVSIR